MPVTRRMLDDLFLGAEIQEASNLNRQLQNTIAAKQAAIAELQQGIDNLKIQAAGLRNELASLTAEKAQFARLIVGYQSEIEAAKKALRSEKAEAELARKNSRTEISRLKAAVDKELKDYRAAQLKQAEAEIEQQKSALEAELKTARKQHQDLLRQAASELKTATDRLKTDREQRQKDIEANHAAELERLAQRHSEAIAALDAERQNKQSELSGIDAKVRELWAVRKAELEQHLRGQLTKAQGQIEAVIQAKRDELAGLEQQIKARIAVSEEEELERIAVLRRQFEVEQQAAIVELRSEQIEAAESLKASKSQVIEEYRGAIEGPLLEEIANLTMELGRVKKKISKENLNWQPQQIKDFFVKEREGRAEPTHVRIGGASESGKSYMINQLVSGGLESLGVHEFDVVLLDPYGSDTKWDVKPTVYDDAEAAAEIVRSWGENAKGDKLPRPTLLMIDEFDTLVSEFDLSQAVKDVVKLGRHRNRFLWAIGQSGNCPKGFQLSDLRNLGQLYLGNVAVDYVENGMKGRNKSKWLGELEALREKSRFHAIVQPKDQNPYTVLIPAQLFPGVTVPGGGGDSEAPQETALKCPKCGSQQVKRDGTYKYKGTTKQRLKCGDCGKGSSVNLEHVSSNET